MDSIQFSLAWIFFQITFSRDTLDLHQTMNKDHYTLIYSPQAFISFNTGMQGYTDTRIQGYKDTRIQGYTDTRIQGYKDTRIQGYKDS